MAASAISSDGRYVLYVTTSSALGATLTVQAVDRAWQMIFPGVKQGTFTEDSRHVLLRTSGDSLGLLSLADGHVRYIAHVTAFLRPTDGDGQWLAYQRGSTGTPDGPTVILLNLITGDTTIYPGVVHCSFSANGHALVLQTNADPRAKQTLQWRSLTDPTARLRVIGQGRQVRDVVFNTTGTGVAFVITDTVQGRPSTAIWFYDAGNDSSRLVVDAATPGMEGTGYKDGLHFGHQGTHLFFAVIPPGSPTLSVSDTGASVRVYGPRMAHALHAQRAVVPVQGHNRVILLTTATDGLRIEENADEQTVLVQGDETGDPVTDLNHQVARRNVYLVSTRDGARTLIARQLPSDAEVQFSARGHYALWFDRVQQQWYAYDIARRTTKNITRGIRVSLSLQTQRPDLPRAVGLAGWVEDDAAVLVSARDDLWQVDPTGQQVPINLTGGIDHTHHLQFRVLKAPPGDLHSYRLQDTLVVVALDRTTKDNGFFQLVLDHPRHVTTLRLDAHAYCWGLGFWGAATVVGADAPVCPIKATRAPRYLMTQQSETEYPNLFVTSDFRTLTPVTHLAPQSTYNWYRTTLLHWHRFDGQRAEGILYIPENFDPHEKYPLIFYYYEHLSASLHSFVHPALSDGALDVGWYVSNGYLVMVPDIDYRVGDPGESVYQAVVSAAQYLAHFPWVNVRKMGLQGHSFGGWETNYLVTRTMRFAAAASASARSDLISGYLEGLERPAYDELNQGRIGATLWAQPARYVRNSPVLTADKVTTPLLILANPEDRAVPSTQGFEWYNALRRLGKTAWLVSYDGEEHILTRSSNQLDYSLRLSQFFDYYLKDASPPQWMTTPMPEFPRWIRGGLALDRSGRTP